MNKKWWVCIWIRSFDAGGERSYFTNEIIDVNPIDYVHKLNKDQNHFAYLGPTSHVLINFQEVTDEQGD